ncbi:Fruiting body protein SC1 [Trametes pubescens]|uniref:Hydrophobin n=1 Tax=Trametes pubescens TaxID=154538 RepID=A0A1M2VNR3_TRAPU|nr:Fruiting body protein SC1 [Trametes pubescens]
MQFKLSLLATTALALVAVAKPHEPRCDSHTTTSTYTPPTSTWTPTTTWTPTPTWTPAPPKPTTTTKWQPQPTVTITETTTRTSTETETISTGRSSHPHYSPTSSSRWSSPTPTPTSPGASTPTGIPAGECNTGSIQCCDQVQDSKSEHMSNIISSLGILPESATGLAGTSCSPINVLALGGDESWYVFGVLRCIYIR